MKLNYRQKLYFYILIIFLVFFNGGIFSVAAIQNSKNIRAQQDSLLIQNNIVLQQIISDIEVVYSQRPQSIPLIIKISPEARAMYGRYLLKTSISTYVAANRIIAGSIINHLILYLTLLLYIMSTQKATKLDRKIQKSPATSGR